MWVTCSVVVVRAGIGSDPSIPACTTSRTTPPTARKNETMTFHVTQAVLRSNHPALRANPDIIPTLLGLADHAHADGTGAYPGVPRLAHYIKRDERTVQRHLAVAEHAGLISKQLQRGKATVYTVNLTALRAYPMPDVGAQRTGAARPGSDAHVTPQGQGVTPVSGVGGGTGVTLKTLSKDPDLKDPRFFKDPGVSPAASQKDPEPDPADEDTVPSVYAEVDRIGQLGFGDLEWPALTTTTKLESGTEGPAEPAEPAEWPARLRIDISDLDLSAEPDALNAVVISDPTPGPLEDIDEHLAVPARTARPQARGPQHPEPPVDQRRLQAGRPDQMAGALPGV